MTSTIYQPQVVEMKNLNNLFIEMTAKNCNQHCKYCYIDFPKYKKIIDYTDINIIKQALEDTKRENIRLIYLTGAEPMTHPDFNAILRLCLKYCNVCICTNGSFINEKKARFLKKVEEESEFEITFKISLTHYNEIQNDDVRYRGAFRHAVFAINHLVKYNFTPIICTANYYNLPKEDLLTGFQNVFKRNNIIIDDSNLQITPWYNPDNTQEEIINTNCTNLDCQTSRVLTTNGVYTCPFLSNDYRGRCGSRFTDYNKKCSLESEYCHICIKNKGPIFAINNNF